MIDVIDNISAYFDDDMVNIIYKDLKSNGLSDKEVENLLKEKHRDLPMIEINDNLNLFIKNINKQEIKGLDPKREDVIIGGTIILKEILEYFKKDFVIVSENDNLMGAILEGVENK